MQSAIAERILRRLEQAETREPDPHLQDDYRIAWITVLRASRGESSPHVSASYAVLGLHPDKVWPAIVARRKVLLGAEYQAFWESPPSLALPPRKPAVREQRGQQRSRMVGLARAA